MPQATAELCKEWDGPSDEKALFYLAERGFRLTKQWNWIAPITIAVNAKDRSAILFLIQEWDFGGLMRDR